MDFFFFLILVVLPLLAVLAVAGMIVFTMRQLKFSGITTGLTTLLCCLFLIFLPTAVNLVENGQKCLSRHGRVIDADTLQGLPGVLVSVKAQYDIGRREEPLFNLDTVTNQDGFYEFPSQLARVPFVWTPFILLDPFPHASAYISALRPGYVKEDDIYQGPFVDEDHWPPNAPSNWPMLWSPEPHFVGNALEMSQMALRKQQLDIDALFLYYAMLKDRMSLSKTSEHFRHALFELANERACHGDPEREISYFVFEAASKLSLNKNIFVDKVEILEPGNTKWDTHSEKQMYKRKYRLRDICEALKATEGSIF